MEIIDMLQDIRNQIKNALLEAQHFLERNIIELEDDHGNQICGFPETEGKNRISQWGGTSTGLAALHMLGMSNDKIRYKLNNAVSWLLGSQVDGAWFASGCQSAEATAVVLLDLKNIGVLENESQQPAIEYLKKCYRSEGYFACTPEYSDMPRIFTTYVVVRTLKKLSELEFKDSIIDWVRKGANENGLWGMVPNSKAPSLVHTVYALKILNYCGYKWDEISKEYRHCIKWLFKGFYDYLYVYENIEILMNKRDIDGEIYTRIPMRHFVLPIIGNFAIEINKVHVALQCIDRILASQFNGGWGPSGDELAIWATYEGCKFLHQTHDAVLKNVSRIDIILSRIRRIPYLSTKASLSILILLIAVIFLWIPHYRPNFFVGIFLAVLPWIYKKGV